MTIQVLFSGPQGKDVPGKVGNLQSIDPVYEGNNVLVGAVLHVIRPLDQLGIICIPLKKYMVTYPINAKYDETDGQNGRWSNFIPAELFKPSLGDIIWMFKNNINKLLLIQGDFLGVESHNMEKQRLNDELVASKVRNQYLHEMVRKLRRVNMQQGNDIWEADVKRPMGHIQPIMKEQASIAAISTPRGYGGRGRRRQGYDVHYDEQPSGDFDNPEERQEGEFVEIPKKGKLEGIKRFLRR